MKFDRVVQVLSKRWSSSILSFQDLQVLCVTVTISAAFLLMSSSKLVPPPPSTSHTDLAYRTPGDRWWWPPGRSKRVFLLFRSVSCHLCETLIRSS